MGSPSSFASSTVFVIICGICVCSHLSSAIHVEHDEDIIKTSIIYDKKTPDVFYCPQEKPNGMNNLLVKAKPLSKLCEYNAGDLPEGYKSDCYGNVDETQWACKEKRRILKRKYPPGMEVLEKYVPLTRKKRAEFYEMYNPDPEKKLRNLITSVSKSSKITVSSSRTKKITEMRGMRF